MLNNAGFVHGGAVMRLCDETAEIVAIRHSGYRIVTAAMDRMVFTSPIYIGELVTCLAQVNAAWNISMEAGLRIEAENPLTGEVRQTPRACLTMVALDPAGAPTPGLALILSSEEDRRRNREAGLRRANRLAKREQILKHR